MPLSMPVLFGVGFAQKKRGRIYCVKIDNLCPFIPRKEHHTRLHELLLIHLLDSICIFSWNTPKSQAEKIKYILPQIALQGTKLHTDPTPMGLIFMAICKKVMDSTCFFGAMGENPAGFSPLLGSSAIKEDPTSLSSRPLRISENFREEWW